MFLFFTVILIIYTTVSLFRNGLLRHKFISLYQRIVDLFDKYGKINTKAQEAVGIGLGILWILFLGIGVVLVQLFYCLSAFKYDPFKIPSLIVLLYLVINTIRLFVKNKSIESRKLDEYTKEDIDKVKIDIHELKKFSFKNLVVDFCLIVYYVYMFIMTIFIK